MQPCIECPEIKLDEHLLSLRGRHLSLVVDLDRQKELVKLALTPNDVSYFEGLLLGIFAEERERYQEELMRDMSKRGSNGE